MCAALSAREAGARVLVVEKAPEAWRGGNGFFTAGGFRFAVKSFEEVCDLVGDLSDEEKASMEVDPYTEETVYDDLMRVTEDCGDPRGAGRRACGGRLRGEPRDAHALSGPQLGPRPRPRHAVQHGRWHPDGARDRRAPVGPLERLPRRPVGSKRAVARRPEGRRQFSEAFVPTGTHREPPRRALRGRGRRLPQLHLREVRTRGHRAAAARRVSDLRRQGSPPAAGGVPDPRGDEGRRPDA